MNAKEEYLKYYSQTHCSHETSMLLRGIGFNEECENMYGLGIFHNGEYLGFDEECELESEGRGNEIERVPGGWIYSHMYTRNSDEWCQTEGSCTMPSYEQVFDYMRKKHGVHIFAMRHCGTWHWCMQDLYIENGSEFQQGNIGYETYGEALDAGIAEVIKGLKGDESECNTDK